MGQPRRSANQGNDLIGQQTGKTDASTFHSHSCKRSSFHCRGSDSAIFSCPGTENADERHVWEKVEITLTANQSFSNPYTDATVWVDLTGPGFNKRVYGFWDGDKTFRVRVTATAPGTWQWVSGSKPADSGLAGKHGSFVAKEWTEAEKKENPLRGGFLCATANQHALETADGTPFFAIGDTWWATGTHCFPWFDDDKKRPMGPEAGFKDYVH